jgi:hypothetical protein
MSAKVGCASCRFGRSAKYLRPTALLHALVAVGMVVHALVALEMVLHALVAFGMVQHAQVALGQPTGGGPATDDRAELVGVS